MTTFVSSSNMAGVDLNNSAPTSAMQTNSAGTVIPPFKVGTRVMGSGETEWVYVQANGAISAYDLVAINSTGTATRATAALAATGSELAFAQNAFSDTDYGWVTTKGNPLTVNVSATSTLQAVLYVAGTSGKLSTTASSGTLAGIALLTASTTAAVASYLAVVTFPKCVGTGN